MRARNLSSRVARDLLLLSPVLAALALFSSGCGKDSISLACGNGSCESGETIDTCPADCLPSGVCGDGVCESTETVSWCADDCFNCSGIRRAETTGEPCVDAADCHRDAVCANIGSAVGRVCVQPCIPTDCEGFCGPSAFCVRTTDGVSGLCIPECSPSSPADCTASDVCAMRDGVSQCVPAEALVFTAESIRAGIAPQYFTGEDWDVLSGPDPEVAFSVNEQEACTTGPAYDTTTASFASACRLPIRVGDDLDVILYEADDLDGSDFVIGCRISISDSAVLRELIAERTIRCTDLANPPTYSEATTWVEFELVAR